MSTVKRSVSICERREVVPPGLIPWMEIQPPASFSGPLSKKH